MIDFENINHFYWIFPWIAFLLYLYRKQNKSFHWIQFNISKRFTSSITKYNSLLKIRLHIIYLFFLGLLLIIATTGPRIDGMVADISGKGKIILVLDGSFSMLAGDTSPHPITKKHPQDRFAEAQIFCEELVDANQDFEYGLISFSGEPAIHSLPTSDIITIKTFIHTLLVHSFSHTGSSFKKVLQAVLKQAYELDGNLQVILLSDGEVPEGKEEDLAEEIEFLKRNKVTIHTVGVGTSAGGGVNFYVSFTEEEKKELENNSNDDSTGTKRKEVDQKIIKKIQTKREDDLLENLAKETGGHYIVVENKKWVKDLIPFIKDTGRSNKSKIKASGKEDLSVYFLIAFLIGFLVDGLYLFRESKVKSV